MTLYYVKQDDSYTGCSEPGCCGESYEAEKITFIDLDGKVNKDRIWSELGGGEPLKWRKATESEFYAFYSGHDKGHDEGSDFGIEWERERIIKLLSDPFYHHIAFPDIHESCVMCHAIALIQGESVG